MVPTTILRVRLRLTIRFGPFQPSPSAPAQQRARSFLRLGGFGFRGRGPRSLPCEPFCLQTLTVVRESLLRDLVLSHWLLGIDLAKCLMCIALGFGGRLECLNPARRLCHFFT